MFNHYVAKLLYFCNCARPDIQMVIAFLNTRVKAPDQDESKKRHHEMRYFRATQELTLTLESDDSLQPSWWVDASFATHHYMKSHTGGLMTLGQGAVYASSRRQNINTCSSTEAELVGMNDVLLQILWTRYKMEAQGYQCKSTPIYQDNMSTILLAKNGRMSSSKQTRHINVR